MDHLQRFLADGDVDEGLRMAADLLGVPKETVVAVARAGLPTMAAAAREDPDVFAELYARITRIRSVSLPAWYAKLAAHPAARAGVTEEFAAHYGPAAGAAARAAAARVGLAEPRAAEILATAMAAIDRGIAGATDGTGEAGLMAWLKAVGAAAGQLDPGGERDARTRGRQDTRSSWPGDRRPPTGAGSP